MKNKKKGESNKVGLARAISVAGFWIEGIYMPDQPCLPFAHSSPIYLSIIGTLSIYLSFCCTNIRRLCVLHSLDACSIYLKYLSKRVEAFCQNCFCSSVAETHKYCFYAGYGNPWGQKCFYPASFAKVLLSSFFCTRSDRNLKVLKHKLKFC